MLHGKKGFERVVWAAKNVLNRSLAWLFYDLTLAGDSGSGKYSIKPQDLTVDDRAADTAVPLSKHHPTKINFESMGRHIPNVRVPPLQPLGLADVHTSSDIGDWSQDIIEWLGLVALESARVQDNDSVDPHLCRWTFPEGTTEKATPIRVLRWRGMVDSGWLTQLLISCM
jgi:ribonucleases P/MRP protein subunit RPP40